MIDLKTIHYPAKLLLKNPAILYIHGWKSSKNTYEDLAKATSLAGFISLTFNLREHGLILGEVDKFSSADYLEDAKNAYDYLVELPNVDPDRITVVGTSFGGYLAFLIILERKVAQLILRAPANYSDDGFQEKGIRGSNYPDVVAWRSISHSLADSLPLRALHGFCGRVLIVESEKDEQIPHQTIQNYINAVADPEKLKYQVLVGASHSLSKDPTNKLIFKTTVLDWLTTT